MVSRCGRHVLLHFYRTRPTVQGGFGTTQKAGAAHVSNFTSGSKPANKQLGGAALTRWASARSKEKGDSKRGSTGMAGIARIRTRCACQVTLSMLL